MTKIDVDAKVVQVDEGDPVAYDYLILCCGVTANHFGIPGAQEHSNTIYTRGAAIDARDLIVSALEDAAQGTLSATEPVFVVVGGGATGVEMAGALAELRNGAVPVAYPELDAGRVKVVLVEMSEDVLGPFHPRLRAYAARALRQRGIDLRLDTAVKEVRRRRGRGAAERGRARDHPRRGDHLGDRGDSPTGRGRLGAADGRGAASRSTPTCA